MGQRQCETAMSGARPGEATVHTVVMHFAGVVVELNGGGVARLERAVAERLESQVDEAS